MATSKCIATTLLKTNTWIFGSGDDLPELELPTIEIILQCCASGCQMCKVLGHELSCRRKDNQKAAVRLRRSLLEANRLDVSSGVASFYFEQVPSEWQRARLDESTPTPNIILAKKWVTDCISNHPRCVESPGYLPTRLLDLKAFKDSNDITLIHTVDVFHMELFQYFALSHCWGGHVPMKTTKHNFRSHQERIKFDELPLSFRDAINITRDLGFRYLWIDSFCIIQDHEPDWRFESDRMADVYGESICTLCADSAENSSQGCRVGARKDAERRSGKVKAPHKGDSDLGSKTGIFRIFSHRPRSWASELGESSLSHPDDIDRPLTRRAWAYQERELSLRMLHFSSNLLLWEYLSFKATSETPWRDSSSTHEMRQYLPLSISTEESLALGGSAEMRDEWYRMVETYSSKDLTKESDKLPALAGLAARFHNQLPSSNRINLIDFPDRYPDGIWKDHLPSALLWRTYPKAIVGYRSPPHRPKIPRAPTWSWASLDGTVSYQSQRSTHIPPAEFVEWYTRILSAKCSKYSPLNGRIEAEGPLVSLRITPRRPKGQEKVDQMLELSQEEWNFVSLVIDDREEVVGLFFQDAHTEAVPSSFQPLFCLGIRNEIQYPASPPPSPSLQLRLGSGAFQISDIWRS